MEFEALGRKIRLEQKIKVIQAGKEVKLSLFADDITLCVREPRNSIRILVEMINPFSKLTKYKIKLQKSVAFLDINNKYKDKDITDPPPFHNNPRENKISSSKPNQVG